MVQMQKPKKHLNKSKYHIYCDFETTGFDPIRNFPIVLALVVADCDFKIQDQLVQKIRPGIINDISWSKEAEVVHGFTKDEAWEFPTQHIAVNNILKFFKPFVSKSPQLFVCHANDRMWWQKEQGCYNTPWFDYWFMWWMFYKAGCDQLYKIIRTENMQSTVKLGRDAGFKKNKLDAWADRLDYKLNHHDALADTLFCLHLHKHLLSLDDELNQTTFELK